MGHSRTHGGAAESFTKLIHASIDHETLPGVLSTAEHVVIDHTTIPGVLSAAEHTATNHTGLTGVGKVVQVVQTSSSSVITSAVGIPDDNTTPLNTEGGLALSLVITPVSTSNRLYLMFTGHMDGSNLIYTTSIHRNSGSSITATRSTPLQVVSLAHSLLAPATSAQTFTVRFGPHVGGFVVYYNANSAGVRRYGGASRATFTIMEVAP